MLYTYIYINFQYFRTSNSYLSYVVLFFCISFLFFYNFILCIENHLRFLRDRIYNRRALCGSHRSFDWISEVSPRYLNGGREYLLLFCLILDCVDKGNDSWLIKECSLYNEHTLLRKICQVLTLFIAHFYSESHLFRNVQSVHLISLIAIILHRIDCPSAKW